MTVSTPDGGLGRALWSAHCSFELEGDGRVVDVSRRLLDLELVGGIGHPLRSMLVPADGPAFDRAWAALKEEDAHSVVLRFSRQHERRACWLQLNFVRPSNESDRVWALGTDVTDFRREAEDARAQLRSLHASKAVIEFNLDGVIRTANPNFLAAAGYELDEIKGQHHRMFVLPEERESLDYREFWRRLGAGESFNAQYQRVRKDGRKIWIEASYCAVKTSEGLPYKIVKFCSDITELVEAFVALEAAADDITTACRQIMGVNDQVESSVRATEEDIHSVAASAEDVLRQADSMTLGIEQLQGSVEDVAANASEAARVAKEAVQTARDSDAQMQRLGVSSEEIGGILKTIASIADQTNLLALNATIEAARAGEAGKGFAVVATEVKELAKETAHATGDIAQKVEAIRSGTSNAMQAIVRILQTIEAIDGAQARISAAVDKQSFTVQEIRRSIEGSRAGFDTMAQGAASSSARAATTKSLATHASSVATGLTELADRLRRLARAADPRREKAARTVRHARGSASEPERARA